MNEEQIKTLSNYLKEMNEILEKILYAQFGIEDKKWLEAMKGLERGFTKAVNYIARIKDIPLPPVLTNEDINKILEA